MSSSCEDLSKFFFNSGYKVYSICFHDSINLKKYCKEYLKIKDFNQKKIEKFLNKIDPNEQKKILIGSGFAESLNSSKIIGERVNFGNSFKILSKVKSLNFLEMIKKKKYPTPRMVVGTKKELAN